MKRALILSDAEREARKDLVQQNRLKRAQGAMIRSSNLVGIISVRAEREKQTMTMLEDSD